MSHSLLSLHVRGLFEGVLTPRVSIWLIPPVSSSSNGGRQPNEDAERAVTALRKGLMLSTTWTLG